MTTLTDVLRNAFSGFGRSTPTTPALSPSVAMSFSGTLREGAQGPQVKQLQVALNAWLSSNGKPGVGTDGVFDAQMTEAVKAFQASQGIAADGVVGRGTVEAYLRWQAGGETGGTAPTSPLTPVRPSTSGGVPELKSGDVVLQRSQSGMAEAIANATHSPFTHVGVVEVVNGRPYVIEAVQPVKRTPFAEWKARGRGGMVEVRRMPGLSEDQAKKIVAKANSFVGRDYDIRYRWDDEKLYCSELVMKAYAAAGLSVGKVESLSSLDLSAADRARAQQLGVSLSETLVTPDSLAKDRHFTTLYTDFFG